MTKEVQEHIGKHDTKAFDFYRLVIDGIRDSNEHHKSKGTRTVAAETYVKDNVAACLHKIVKENHDVSNNFLVELLGVTSGQIKHARNRVKDMIDNKSLATELKRFGSSRRTHHEMQCWRKDATHNLQALLWHWGRSSVLWSPRVEKVTKKRQLADAVK